MAPRRGKNAAVENKFKRLKKLGKKSGEGDGRSGNNTGECRGSGEGKRVFKALTVSLEGQFKSGPGPERSRKMVSILRMGKRKLDWQGVGERPNFPTDEGGPTNIGVPARKNPEG